MRLFLRRILLFAFPLLLVWGLLWWMPYDQEAGFRYLREHCHNGAWLQHRLFQDDRPMDVVCLGSSRMMCALSDSLLSDLLSDKGKRTEVINLGYCRYGRSLHRSLGELAMDRFDPKVFLVEVRQTEDGYSHPDFPYLARSSALWANDPFRNRRYLEQIEQGAESRFLALRNQLLDLKPSETFSKAESRPHWFNLDGPLLHIREDHKGPDRELTPIASTPPLSYPHHQLQAFATKVLNQGGKVIFLFLPDYQSPAGQEPIDLSFYQSLGEVLLPPDSITQPEAH
ncbi:MAG: hypothetical protein AAF399_25605, partial [Bacteroidota bacterium]